MLVSLASERIPLVVISFGAGVVAGAALLARYYGRHEPTAPAASASAQPADTRSGLALLKCSVCSAHKCQSEFASRQVRRHEHVRKCRRCIDTYVETPELAAAKEARKARKAAEAAQAVEVAPSEVVPTADRIDDPLRLARKAETVLRGRTDRVLLVLENCSDDLNHVAVLRTCEALGVMRVWLIAKPSPSTEAGTGAAGASTAASDPDEGGEANQRKAANSRATRRFQARAAQRGLEFSPLLGPRQAQLYASHLDVRTFSTTRECIDAVRQDGRDLWVTDLSQEAIPLTSDREALAAALPSRLAVVIGSEGVGISQVMSDAADVRVFLPMWGFTESFNISVATALVLSRILDATAANRGALPAEEMGRLRREWYAGLARTDEQRTAFSALADRGGAPVLCDTRRPEAHRDEQRGRGGDKRRIWSEGV